MSETKQRYFFTVIKDWPGPEPELKLAPFTNYIGWVPQTNQ